MIQRIQTIYLLLVAILMTLTVFSPLATLVGNELVYSFNACGIYQGAENMSPTWGVLTFACLSAILALVSIFLYKNRKRQIKIVNWNSILIVLFYITVAVYYLSTANRLDLSFSNVSYGIALPVVALVLNVLAVTKIKADEKLVQSLNRIR